MAETQLPFASTLDVLARLVPEQLQKPRIGIVCGSGLSTLVSSLRDVVEVPYTALEGFAKSTGKSTTSMSRSHDHV
jgi:purine-nucleoside phosphorylase